VFAQVNALPSNENVLAEFSATVSQVTQVTQVIAIASCKSPGQSRSRAAVDVETSQVSALSEHSISPWLRPGRCALVTGCALVAGS
jgi:hypothetical protein